MLQIEEREMETNSPIKHLNAISFLAEHLNQMGFCLVLKNVCVCLEVGG